MAVTTPEGRYVVAINRVRESHGLPPLTIEPALVVGGRRHAAHLIATNTFAHGGAWWKWIVRAGATGRHLGENLGWCTAGSCPDAAPAVLMRMWLASRAHRLNILDPVFRHIGVGIAVGRFHGWPRAYVVATEFDG